MDFLNPAVTDGVDLFVNIMITLISFAGALLLIDMKREKEKGES